MLKKFLSQFSRKVGIDLGTANTIIAFQEQGIVINEPSIIAINNRVDQIIAIGEEANKMMGKTPSFISISKPLVNGKISDYEISEKMLKYFFDKLHKNRFNFSPRPLVVISLPLDVTEVEKKAVEDAAMNAGASSVMLVEDVMAAAIGARLPIQEASGSMIVDLGAGKTQTAVISLSGVVTYKTSIMAGEELNKNIIQYARDNFNLLLGEKKAETIKTTIGSAYELKEPLSIEMRGRDLISGLPREIIVNDTQIREALMPSIMSIVEDIKLTLENTPPEIVADIYERGIVLTGGAALLKNLDKLIAEHTKIPVRIANDPITACIRGISITLDNNELLKEIIVPSAREDQIRK